MVKQQSTDDAGSRKLVAMWCVVQPLARQGSRGKCTRPGPSLLSPKYPIRPEQTRGLTGPVLLSVFSRANRCIHSLARFLCLSSPRSSIPVTTSYDTSYLARAHGALHFGKCIYLSERQAEPLAPFGHCLITFLTSRSSMLWQAAVFRFLLCSHLSCPSPPPAVHLLDLFLALVHGWHPPAPPVSKDR